MKNVTIWTVYRIPKGGTFLLRATICIESRYKLRQFIYQMKRTKTLAQSLYNITLIISVKNVTTWILHRIPTERTCFCSLSSETLQYLFLPAVYKVLLIRVIPIPDYGVLKEVVWIYFKADEYTFVVIKQENEHHTDNLDEDKKCHQMGVLQKKKIFFNYQFLITSMLVLLIQFYEFYYVSKFW